jgi:hypothetical protein
MPERDDIRRELDDVVNMPPKQAGPTRARPTLMSWGHDPLEPG